MSASIFARYPQEEIESFYHLWQNDPTQCPSSWASFFEGYELGLTHLDESPPSSELPPTPSPSLEKNEGLVESESSEFRGRAALLIFAYRALGHQQAWFNPLKESAPLSARLSPKRFGLTEKDLEKQVNLYQIKKGEALRLRDIIEILKTCYCGFTGFEFMHIHTHQIRNWIQTKIEERELGVDFGPEYAEKALTWLLEAEMFEEFLGKKFLGEKRFSLEGAEGLMVILNTLLEACPENGVEEIEMGMPHRGRLNVLANFLRKSLKTILYEFTPNYIPDMIAGDGDVKYHLGYEKVRRVGDKDIRLSLAANPSHLEAVDPIVEGKARARQRLLGDDIERKKVLPLLLHGDAAFAGQGLVAEVFNLSQLRGYRTGGTIHVVVNNQIGFTTLPADSRSSTYATDIAKMVEAPILHINGEKPMELIWAALFALEFRSRFGKDIVLDMYCYRRQGHNETDQTAFTAPTLAKLIDQKIPLAHAYQKELIEKGIITEEKSQSIIHTLSSRMEEEYQAMLEKSALGGKTAFSGSTATPQAAYSHSPVLTGIPKEQLQHIGQVLTSLPDNFSPHPLLANRFLPRRKAMLEEKQNFDWALGEALAFGSLLMEGFPVRLSGQDSRRGTFSQRHAVFYDYNTRERYIPLKHLSEKQGIFRVFNSSLSEASVLGFEYGYSLGLPQMLTLWEAQFGDFANGAQVIIDQFIVAAEDKWQTPSSIVLLLPHGYDGQGAEHSSARLERFLQLCANDNIQVLNLTTPAQYFHALRRQKHQAYAKPLILMTPKSMLSHPQATSSEADFLSGTSFQTVLPDPLLSSPEKANSITRLLFCSGKLFYELEAYRKEHALSHVSILRLEQLYPFPEELLKTLLEPYSHVKDFLWVQEEPANMGAWSYLRFILEELVGQRLSYAGRPASPSPAEGAKALHYAAQKRLIAHAFGEKPA